MLTLNFTQQLGDLTLQIDQILPAQGITAIFGLSGAGKTSLINAISGLTKPQSGYISLNERILVDCDKSVFLPVEKRKIGYVFQDARLFPHYTVSGNLKYGMAKSMKSQFGSIVKLLGIQHLLTRYPVTLSGGEKQRVAIGRALLTAPELLLMDEPLAALDLPRKRELLSYLERLSHEVHIPILYVSHSLEEIVRLAEYVVVLEQGKVLAAGELEQVWASEVLRPWLAQEQQSNIINVAFVKHHEQYAMSALTLGEQLLWVNQLTSVSGHNLRVQIRADDISITLSKAENSSIRNILCATVINCQQQESTVLVKLQIDQHIVWAKISQWAYDELKLQPEQAVYAQIKSVSIHQ